jgi:hypothetical protein
MPALATAAAIASIVAVVVAIQSVIGAVNAMNDAASAQSALAKTNAQLKASAAAAYAAGDKSKGDKLTKAANIPGPAAPSFFDQLLTGTIGQFASGGFTGRGGVNDVRGVVHAGEYVVPQSGVDQSTGLPKAMSGGNTQTITIQNVNLNTESAVKAFFNMTDKDAQSLAMGLTPARGRI